MENQPGGNMAHALNNAALSALVRDVLGSAQRRDYAGYSKFDALNSPFIHFLSFNNPWLRFGWTQLVKSFPVNLRPFVGVKISRNQKGIALFARSYLSLYEKEHNEQDLKEAESLLDWLIQNRCSGHSDYCWGYNYTWQSLPPFIQVRGEPCIIVTIFAGEAFMHAFRVTGNRKYLEIAESSCRFILDNFKVLHEDRDTRAISYTLHTESHIVLNIQALSAALFVKVWKHTHDEALLQTAVKQFAYVVVRKNTDASWNYSYPPGRLHLVDNYHTGGILDAFAEFFEETGDGRFTAIYRSGLDYYEKHLFEPDGAPRWMAGAKYPHDVHGAAQGIISFCKASKQDVRCLAFANTIASWAIGHLYRPQSRDFIYRQGRFLKWNFSLMHWCNAWMARALAELLQEIGRAHV
jgi:hypothetical protein